jgi:hypothetical protein
MDANIILSPHFNLTGQVTIQNIPEFMGNYSLVYRGIVHGNLVSLLCESINIFTYHFIYDLGRRQDHQAHGRARINEAGEVPPVTPE